MAHASTSPLQAAQQALLAQLIEHGLLLPSGVAGIYGRSALFEDVLSRFMSFVTRSTAGDEPTHVHFPPVMSRQHMEKTDYLDSFPQLAGLIYSFEGDDAEHRRFADMVRNGEDWSRVPKRTEVTLAPAACHPLYPTCAGRLPREGRLFDLTSYCFRHEPSEDPARMQMFRMREHVRMGKPDDVRAWRDLWIERGLSMLGALGLPAYVAPANDPFFGRTGRMLAANQRQQALKFEIVLPITSSEHPTAIMSFNYHQDHFAEPYGITTHDGAVAHSACLGFGLERIVIGLFKTHGFDPSTWPLAVRNMLFASAP